MTRPSVYEFAGGEGAFLRLAAAHFERAARDPELNHAFAGDRLADGHVERFAAYLGEVFGGPPRYSREHGGHSRMLTVHAGNGPPPSWTDRFIASFMQAVDDAGLPDDPEFRGLLRSYIEWAAREVEDYGPPGSAVPPHQSVPRWSWDGPQR